MSKRKLSIIVLTIIIAIFCVLFLKIFIRNMRIKKEFKNVLVNWKTSDNFYYSQINKENGEKEEIYHIKDIDLIIKDGKKIYITDTQRITVDMDTNEIIDAILKNTQTITTDLLTNELKESYSNTYSRIDNFSYSSDYIYNVLYNGPSVEEKISNIKSGEFNNQKCYVLSVSHNEIIYIDDKTYLPIGFNSKNKNYICELKFDNIQENDIEIPSLQ